MTQRQVNGHAPELARRHSVRFIRMLSATNSARINPAIAWPATSFLSGSFPAAAQRRHYPVDFLVQSIVQFAHAATHFGQVYHVVQTEPISARVVFDDLIQKNYISRYVSAEDWITLLHAKAKADNDYVLSVVAQSLPDMEAVLTDQNVYDGSRFEAALRQHGLHQPRTDLAYFDPLLQRLDRC